MLLVCITLAVVVCVTGVALKRYLAYRDLFDNLPGETDTSFIYGNLNKYPGLNERGLAFDLGMARKYKYFHRSWFGPFIALLSLYHPDVIRPVLKSSAPKPRSSVLSSVYDMGIPWLGEGLLLTNSDRWARNRRLITPSFHFDILRPYVDIYNRCVDIMLTSMLEKSNEKKSFDLYSLVSLETLDVILRCAFSFKSECQTTGSGSEYSLAISELQKLWCKRALSPHLYSDFIYRLTSEGRRFHHLCDIAHKVASDIIDKRKQELKTDLELIKEKKVYDFLDMILIARDEDGLGLSPLEIRNEVDTFLFEGHDTTASGITWTLYSLARHPEHQAKVYDEVVSVLGDREDVEWKDLPKLEFTTMCIKESLRMNAAVPYIERYTDEDLYFQGHWIPKGTLVTINIWLLHNNPHLWLEPTEFRPERFHPDQQMKMDPFQFLPFSAGSRNCIGQNFAMNEMKVTVAKVIKNFLLTTDPHHDVLRLPNLTMKAEDGLLVFAQPRTVKN